MPDLSVEGYRGCGHCEACISGYLGHCPGESALHDQSVVVGSKSLLDFQPSRGGGFSQYLYLWPTTRFHKVPDHVPDKLAALAIPFGNGWQWAYMEGNVGPGQQGLACTVASTFWQPVWRAQDLPPGRAGRNWRVLEQGKWIGKEEGTVQGGNISPLLSNIYLHYVFDLWVHWWRRKRAQGDMIVVRFADDWVMGFQDAQGFVQEFKKRRFGLALHPDKTRLIEFGRFAAQSRKARGQRKPQTFNFLGFTHIYGKTRKGKFTVLRKTRQEKWLSKLKAIKVELRRCMHLPIPVQGTYLRSVLIGHMRYYSVPRNLQSVKASQYALQRVWWKVLARRSQKGNLTWERKNRLIARYFPPVRIYHPYLLERFSVLT